MLSCANFNYGITIDGTACSGKSTFIKPFNGLKVNTALSFENVDSFFPATLGYLCKGREIIKQHPFRIWDRRITNVLEWNLLWQILKISFCLKDQHKSDEEIKTVCTSMTSILFKRLKNSSLMNDFICEESNFAFIYSDIKGLKERMKTRNGNSDKLRWDWDLYHHLQNVMYKELYGDRVLDLYNLNPVYLHCIKDLLFKNLKTDKVYLPTLASPKFNYMELNHVGLCDRAAFKNEMLEENLSSLHFVTYPGDRFQTRTNKIYTRPITIPSVLKYASQDIIDKYISIEEFVNML